MGKLLDRYREKNKVLKETNREYYKRISELQKELDDTDSFYKAAIEEKNKRIYELEKHLRKLGITKP